MSYRLHTLLDPERIAECHQHDAQQRRRHTRAARMVTTRAGITIGIAWTPPAPQFSRDAESIQRALLEPRTREPLRGIARIVGALWRAC